MFISFLGMTGALLKVFCRTAYLFQIIFQNPCKDKFSCQKNYSCMESKSNVSGHVILPLSEETAFISEAFNS